MGKVFTWRVGLIILALSSLNYCLYQKEQNKRDNYKPVTKEYIEVGNGYQGYDWERSEHRYEGDGYIKSPKGGFEREEDVIMPTPANIIPVDSAEGHIL